MLAPLLLASMLVAPLRGEIVVHVVDEAGKPIIGAWVTCVSGSGTATVELPELCEWLEAGAEGAPTRGALWLRTDEEGAARVRECGVWNDVVAVTRELGGHSIVPRGTTEDAKVMLRPHRYWRVRVVDPDDSTARFALPVCFGRENGVTASDEFDALARLEPGAPGDVVAFGPLDLVLDPDEIDPILVARLEFPGLVRPLVRARASTIGAEATVIALPPYGCFEVHVVDAAGELVRKPIDVAITTNEFFQLGLPGPYFGALRREGPTAGGIVRFEPFGLGLSTRVELVERDESTGTGMTTKALNDHGVLDALERKREVRVVTLVAPKGLDEMPPLARRVVVGGRALDSAGAPLALHALSVQVIDVRSGETVGRLADREAFVVTDAEGRFAASLDVDSKLPEGASLLVVDTGRSEARARRDLAWRRLDVEPGTGWRGGELGDLRLAPLPLLLSGRVVDEQGAPLPHLLVSVACDHDAFLRDESIPAWWRNRYSHHGRACDDDGGFEVRGFAGAQRWTVKSWELHGAYGSSGPTPIEPGTSGLILRCDAPEASEGQSTGGLFGSLLLDADVPRTEVAVELVRLRTEDEAESSQSEDLLRDRMLNELPADRFGREDLSAGSYRLRVMLRTFANPAVELARRDAIEIVSGVATVLPPIDLRGKVKTARLKLVDRAGALVPTGHVFSRERALNADRSGDHSLAVQPEERRFHGGELTLCTATDWPPIEILGLGCRRLIVTLDAPGERTIVLPPPRIVRIRLPAGIRLPPSPLTLDASMYTDQIMQGVHYLHGGGPPRGAAASFGLDGVVELPLPAAARYQLGVTVYHRTSGRSERGSWSSSNGRDVRDDVDIEVDDSDDVLEIDVDVTQEAIDRTAGELGFRRKN